MRAPAIRRLTHGAAELDSPLNDRRGITLLARPPAAITAVTEDILGDFRRAESDQYYYPAADIHLPILSIISCYPGVTLAAIDPRQYQAALRDILREASPFCVRFADLTASPGGIIVQGFPEDEGLHDLRAKLGTYFRAATLQQSIDQRYSIQTAYSPVIHFQSALADIPLLLKKMAKYERCFIGSFKVETVELVYNDWYQRQANAVLFTAP